MLGNLKICCTFKEKGCDVVINLENLDNHLISCRFNKKICKECECEILNQHNCVQSLLELNKYLREDFNSVLSKNEILTRKLQNSKLEIESYLQTIQDFSSASPQKSETFSKVRKNFFHT